MPIRLADQLLHRPRGKELAAVPGVVSLSNFVLEEEPHGIHISEFTDEHFQAATAKLSGTSDGRHLFSSPTSETGSTTRTVLETPGREAFARKSSSVVTRTSAFKCSAHARWKASSGPSPLAWRLEVRVETPGGVSWSLF